jgi:hypothetical protein
VNTLRRIAIMAEMHGRDLTRRHASLALLVALPLCFYLASGRSGASAVAAGGIGMAFAVSGASLFSILSSSEVDQRLVLGGYRPVELLLGRLAFLAPLGLAVATGFSVLMTLVSHPTRPWLLGVGVGVVALQSVPFGLAVGSIVSRELEGTLVLIGVVGVQMAVDPTSPVSKFLPFYGPRQLLASSMVANGPILLPLVETAAYGFALLVVARIFMSRRVNVQQPQPLVADDPATATRPGPTRGPEDRAVLLVPEPEAVRSPLE